MLKKAFVLAQINQAVCWGHFDRGNSNYRLLYRENLSSRGSLTPQEIVLRRVGFLFLNFLLEKRVECTEFLESRGKFQKLGGGAWLFLVDQGIYLIVKFYYLGIS